MARPLKRVMQKELQDPPAQKVLLGDILEGLARRGRRLGSLNFGPCPVEVRNDEAA